MPAKTTIAFCLLFLCTIFCYSQERIELKLPANRTKQVVNIDGNLNDPAWKDAALMTNLVEFRPTIGAKELYEVRTETWLMYDDDGIYFGGYCHERTKDSISKELAGRDGFGMNDYVGLIFDTYHDKINGFEYFVTPLNEQWDAKMSPSSADSDNGGEDFSWNAVWKSGAVIHNDGWSFEMFIPYSAIRFGKDKVQDWGLNITRRRRKTEQQYTWNPINPNVNGFLTQEGVWTGITNIKPPIRLQFSPYFSVYTNHYPSATTGIKSWTNQVNGGLDVKYGINQAFTLDATLIPDFGQVQSDNQVLNLTPFEVRFNENRSFFTEGTELFSKGNLFYSRRIGGTPLHLYDAGGNIGVNEKLLKNPSESKLINASKISGRTQNGFGIGFLNAITKPQYATIETATGEERKYETDPLTNYNILVLDQTLKNNSTITLVNTSVLRSGSDYDANVTAGLFDLYDKKNVWNINGKIATSMLFNYEPGGKTRTGYNHRVSFGKNSGLFTFNVWQEVMDTKYTHNDLGYFTNNNFVDHGAYMGYRWVVPKDWYNRINVNFNANVSRLLTPIGTIDTKFQTASVGVNANAQTKKLSWVGVNARFTGVQNDFYEPRLTGYHFRRGATVQLGTWYESNGAKKYSFFTELYGFKSINFYDQFVVDFALGQNYRFNQQFSVSYRIGWSPRYNGIGFATIDSDRDKIIFGRRKVNTIENVLSFKYNFTNKMGLTFRARHYMSSVHNRAYYWLQNSGKLTVDNYFTGNADRNVNFFNIDMVYTWQFAPGSFLNIVWKDAAAYQHDEVERNYFKNFERTFNSDQNNNLSIKVIYFLDYLQLKRKRN
ncbi:MAG: carbohydrate binding family 9 domain-containing protein [Chitinophagaceae bacterium]|nr:carbohydrate binding family 9 domain-containing protein [Chitinophagaceae bacterium]